MCGVCVVNVWYICGVCGVYVWCMCGECVVCGGETKCTNSKPDHCAMYNLFGQYNMLKMK